MANINFYVPGDKARAKMIMKGWAKLAERVTPDNPAGIAMSASQLVILISEAAMADPVKVARLVGAIIGGDESQ